MATMVGRELLNERDLIPSLFVSQVPQLHQRADAPLASPHLELPYYVHVRVCVVAAASSTAHAHFLSLCVHHVPC